MDKVIIFDTTLRDGEQAAGASLNPQEKLEIARQLEKLGVDVIEAGFPASSAGDFEAVQLISKEVQRPIICALSFANADAIDKAWEAIKEAKKRGCQYYNFWGIHQPGRTPKSWDGLTLFKQGFGGDQVNYLTTQDLILSPKYFLTYWYEKYLNWRRGV